MNAPRVSIVTPSFNQGRYLENTMASVLEQGYGDLEYFVMDGRSTDGSVEIIQRYAKYLTFWQSQPDGGQVEAINAGFRRSTGQILAFLNSDDFLLPGAIQHMAELYLQHPEAAGWVGGGYTVARDGYILQTRIPQRLGRDDLADWEENWIYQPGCFFSAKVARAVGPFNPAYENCFDFDFWLRIASAGPLIPTRRIIAAATMHPESKTLKYQTRMYEEMQAIQHAYGYDSCAERTRQRLEQVRKQKTISRVAKLLYETHSQKRTDPDRFVRMPERPKDV
jgi:glycosyltransferase involved in cell wall biosynthesis